MLFLSEPLIDSSMLSGDVIPTVRKANAEEFIHIFVNNSRQLMEFLEHMIKVCRPHQLPDLEITHRTHSN